MPDSKKILLFEDNPDHKELFTLYLEMTRFASAQVKCVPSLQQGKELLASDYFDIAFLDLSLIDSSYSETLAQIDSLTSTCPIVVLTSLDDRSAMMNIINKGADDCLSKSNLNESSLERTIQYNLSRWKMRKQLSHERQRLQEIIRGTNVGTWEWDIQTGELQLNERWAEMIGYTLDELTPVTIDNWRKLAHPDDLEQSDRSLKKHFSGELDYYECESRMRHKNGQWIWVLDSGKVVEWSKQGQPLRASGTHADITERKLTEEKLQLAAHVFSDTHEGIALTDANGIIIDVNPTFTEITEYSRQEVMDKNPNILQSGMQSSEFYTEMWKILIEQGHWRGEIWNRKKGGELYAERLTISAMYDEKGKVRNYVGLFTDITRQKRAAEALRKSNEALDNRVRERTFDLQKATKKAEEANMAKGIFIANMSHEFRTPLNAVLGFSQLMLDDKTISDKQREHLNTINKSGQHQLSLINDVLAMSNLEDGQTTLDLQAVNFIELLDKIIDKAKAASKVKKITFDVEYESDLPQYIYCDYEKLKSLLSNVIANAIKYTQSGGVTLKIKSIQTHLYHSVKLVFDVIDSGIGIPQECLKRIFMPFYQVSELGNKIGTGLGLTLAQRFLELMGGDISVESELDRGTKFHIELPIEPVTAPSIELYNQKKSIEPDGNEYRVLLIYNKELDSEEMKKLLESVGFFVREAPGGQQAVDVFKSWHPQIILLDMPVMDCMDTVKMIRAIEEGAKTLIAALPTFPLKTLENEKRPSELDEFISKPIDPTELFDCMAKHLNISYRYAENSEPAEAEEKIMLLTAKDLNILDKELLNELADASNALDMEKTLEVAERIKKNSPAIANALIELVNLLDFETLQGLINSEQE